MIDHHAHKMFNSPGQFWGSAYNWLTYQRDSELAQVARHLLIRNSATRETGNVEGIACDEEGRSDHQTVQA
jgi:hypothetical protein